MKYRNMLFALVVVGITLSVRADEPERDSFGKWRVAFGGGFNGAVKSHLGMRNLPAPVGYAVPAGSRTLADAMRRAAARVYDGDGYIDVNNDDNGYNTENWKLPVDSYKNYQIDPLDGYFDLRNAYHEVSASSFSGSYDGRSDDPYPFGVSFEASRELWAHDEAFEHRWGVDFAAAFSYFFQRDVYRANARLDRADTVREGSVQTVISDPDAMYEYIEERSDHPVGGMYGHGNLDYDYNSPALLWERVNASAPVDLGGVRTVSSSRSYSARGDYHELEMLFLLRPWYELTDWWRFYGEIGVGVSWGNFESDVSGSGIGHSEDFKQWDCYGVAGLGTMIRYGMFDLSVDFLGRFLRDDLDVNGKYLNGRIDRSDWGFRVMVGVEF